MVRTYPGPKAPNRRKDFPGKEHSMRGISLLVILVALVLTGPLAKSDSNSLPTCQGVPQSKPSEVVFACGDGNVYAHSLVWTDWGDYYAYAQGTLVENDCTPNCAAGHFHSHQVSLTAYGKQRCPNGELAYRSVAYTITDPMLPASVTAQASFNFPCKPM